MKTNQISKTGNVIGFIITGILYILLYVIALQMEKMERGSGGTLLLFAYPVLIIFTIIKIKQIILKK